MLNKKLEKAINDQLNFELYSSYIYLSMSAYFSSIGLDGFANWMQIQTEEEVVHAMKFYKYVLERDGVVQLDKIDKPKLKWKTPLEAFEDAYKHEQIVTGRIHKLMDLALEEKDHPTVSFLHWYVDEQVEEEANAKQIVDQLKLVKDAPQGLFMIDKELGARVFNMPGGAGVTLFGVAPTA